MILEVYGAQFALKATNMRGQLGEATRFDCAMAKCKVKRGLIIDKLLAHRDGLSLHSLVEVLDAGMFAWVRRGRRRTCSRTSPSYLKADIPDHPVSVCFVPILLQKSVAASREA
jgi:hypothetical protein